jgi:alpha-beta hydrolase superfamily lysophospholipase
LPLTFHSFTATDGYTWSYRHYPAAGAPRAELVCIHGIQSHGGWYEYSCSRHATAGYSVSFLDRRGAGRNQAARGDTPGFRRLLDDIAEFLRPLRTSNPDRPVVLSAVSWGGKLAIGLQKRHPGLVDGLILLCPGFFPKVRPSFPARMRILGARLFRPSRLFPIPLSDPELFTATPRWLDFLRHDSLALHQATARFLVESVRLDYYLRWAARRVAVPVLALLGGSDRIIDNDRTRTFLNRLPAPTQVIEYPTGHHTLEFEPEPDRFIDDQLRWLQSLVSRERLASASDARSPDARG